MKVGDLASSVGKGLFAGAIGTAAMTVSSTLEMKARDRAASTAPADAAGKVLGVEPKDEAGRPAWRPPSTGATGPAGAPSGAL